MRRILFAVLASGALCVAVPSIAAARHHNGKHHHRSHTGVRHEHFGATSTPTPTTPTAPTTPGTVTPTSAGTVASFTNGVLTIKLTDGSMVTGTVTANTELECQAGAPAQMQSDDHGGGSDTGGRSGSGDNGDSGDTGDDGDAAQCATTALTPGAVVAEAELSISSAGSVWDKVELA